jgi:hypothetical protein
MQSTYYMELSWFSKLQEDCFFLLQREDSIKSDICLPCTRAEYFMVEICEHCQLMKQLYGNTFCLTCMVMWLRLVLMQMLLD